MEGTPNVNVFEFSKPTEYLSSLLETKQKINPRFSLRAWARQMGFASPAVLSMILNQKRKLHPKQAIRIKNTLGFSEEESRYFDFLILYANAPSLGEKEFYENVLKTLRPDNQLSSLDLDHFKLISDWYHIAILEMVRLSDFKEDPQWIGQRLMGEISKTKIKDAIQRLLRLNLLTKDASGKLVRTQQRIATPTDIPDEGIKRFHAQRIENALVALKDDFMDERDITAQTVISSKLKIKEAKKMIQTFRRRLSSFLESGPKEEVVQLNVQLFKLTNKRKKS